MGTLANSLSAARPWRLRGIPFAVIVRNGRRSRPANTQPSPSATAAMIATAVPEATASWCRSELARVTPARPLGERSVTGADLRLTQRTLQRDNSLG
jgi:hypothetical protein